MYIYIYKVLSVVMVSDYGGEQREMQARGEDAQSDGRARDARRGGDCLQVRLRAEARTDPRYESHNSMYIKQSTENGAFV